MSTRTLCFGFVKLNLVVLIIFNCSVSRSLDMQCYENLEGIHIGKFSPVLLVK